MQYLPHLEEIGFEVDICPLFDEAYVEDLYAGRRNRSAILKSYGKRLLQMHRSDRYDLVWMEKEAMPWLPLPLEQIGFRRRTAMVVDYDDAVFHRYDRQRNGFVRLLLGNKIAGIMHGSDVVIAGNRYLAEYAEHAGASRVEIIPTVVDTYAYKVRPPEQQRSCVTIGWIGTPGTWRECAVPFLGPLSSLVEGARVKFLAVGAGEGAVAGLGFEVRSWSEETEIASIQEMDIGIMPLPDTPWMRGKCGYKLIQYMACGLPVVASPVGVNSEIVEHGVNGFLAETDEDWRKALEALIRDPALRERMGHAGREKVESWYSLQVQGPRVARLLAEVAQSRQAEDS